jgi:WD40 repeat protein
MIHEGTKAVTSGLGQEVVVWDLPYQKKIHAFTQHRGNVYALAGSPTEDLVISGGDHLVYCWDPNTLQVRWEGLVELNQECWWAQFDQSGSKAITGSEKGIVSVWDVKTGDKIARIEGAGPKKDSDGASISPDGKYVAIFMRNPHVIQLWDIETSKLVWKVPANTNRGVTFSPHGRWLATGNQDGSIDLLDVKNGGQLMRRFLSHQNSVNDIAFTLDSERMFSCSSDGWVKVWDPKTGDQVLSLPVDNKIRAWNIEVSQNGDHMIVADEHGGINIWSLAQ